MKYVKSFFNKHYATIEYVRNGARKSAPEENCPPVRVRVWFRISVRIRAGAIFLEDNFPRTVKN